MDFTDIAFRFVSDLFISRSSTTATTIFLDLKPTAVAAWAFLQVYIFMTVRQTRRAFKPNQSTFRSAGGGWTSSRRGAYFVSITAAVASIASIVFALWFNLRLIPPRDPVDALVQFGMTLAMAYYVHRTAISNSGLHRLWTLIMSVVFPRTCKPIFTAGR
jgi:hypothetical protein